MCVCVWPVSSHLNTNQTKDKRVWNSSVEKFPADVPAVNLDSQSPEARICSKQVKIEVFGLSYSICFDLDCFNPAKPSFALCGPRLALQSIAFYCAIMPLFSSSYQQPLSLSVKSIWIIDTVLRSL